LRGRLGNKDLSSINRLEERGMYLIPEPKTIALPIKPWEKERIEELAKEKKLSVNITPGNVIIDIYNLPIVMDWVLDHDHCPFFKNNMCLIHDSKPLVCKSYPILSSGLSALFSASEQGALRMNTNITPDCKASVRMHGERKGKLNDHIEMMHDSYGATFESAIAQDFGSELVFNIIEELVNRGLIKTYRMSRAKVMKRLNQRRIGLIEYVINKGIMSKEEFQEQLKIVNNAYDFIQDEIQSERPFVETDG